MLALNKIKIKKSHIILWIASILVLSLLAFFIHVACVRANGDILSNFSFSKSYEDNNGKLIQVFLTEDDWDNCGDWITFNRDWWNAPYKRGEENAASNRNE